MISYDDLVVALSAWRARQGLSVVQGPGSVAPRAPAPAQPARSAPPNAPPRPGARAPAPDQDFDDSALVEEAPYDVAGDDYVVALSVEQPVEPTAISSAPEPDPTRKRNW
jgi:hypothetical protein